MKKRVLALVLSALILCALPSCAQEYEYGTFYEEDGILQNTQITLVLEADELTAPVGELSFSLQEKSDWYVQEDAHISGTDCTHLLEIYKNGVWQEVQRTGILQREPLGNLSADELDYQAHHTYDGAMTFYASGSLSEIQHYPPLDVGHYRIRIKYSLYAADENAYIPEGQLEAVAYFTVTAPEPPEYGTFYEEDGILQNTAITASMESQDLVAPVKELKYVLHDNSDYWVEDLVDKKPYEEWNVDAIDVLEVYQDGTWQAVATCGQGATEIDRVRQMGNPWENRDIPITMRFYLCAPEDERGLIHYDYLAPGHYRIRVTYEVFTNDENAYIPEGQLEAVAYFTVTAPENG